MTIRDVTDVATGRAIRLLLHLAVTALVGVISYSAYMVKDEFKDFNEAQRHQDEILRQHGEALAQLNANVVALTTDLRSSVDTVRVLAQTIQDQATAEAQLKQRVDDYDPILRSIPPLGASRGRGG